MQQIKTERKHMITLNELMTPEVRQQILADSTSFEESLNVALTKYQVKFTPGSTLSKMVKASPKYQALDKDGQTKFFNEVKSLFKLHKVGERLAAEAIARGFWARFNGTGVYGEKAGQKAGQVKQVNIALMHPDEKASKLDGQLTDVAKRHAAEERASKAVEQAKRFRTQLQELGVEVPELEVISVEIE